MTDIGGGIFSLIVTAIFLNFWKPKKEWHFDQTPASSEPSARPTTRERDPHATEVAALLGTKPADTSFESKKLTVSATSRSPGCPLS